MAQLLLGFSILILFGCTRSSDTLNPPSCQLTGIDLFGSSSANDRYAVVYDGENIKEINTIDYTYKYTYDVVGKLIRKESQDLSYPYRNRTEFTYNSSGQLTQELEYEDGSTVPTERTTYAYVSGKLREIKNRDLPTGYEFSFLITWTGEDISKVEAFEAGVLECTQSYTYDLALDNTFNRDNKYYYWQDPSDDYEPIREALFLSKHALKSTTGDCSSNMVDNITYTYNSQNKIKTIRINANLAWTFENSCD